MQTTLYGARVLKGNATTPDQTFMFPVQCFAQSPSEPIIQKSSLVNLIGVHFYTAAAPTSGGVGDVKEYAIAKVVRGSNQFVGLTPKQVLLNDLSRSKTLTSNPLYDKGIAYFSLLNADSDGFVGSNLHGNAERPVLVAADNLDTIYMINNYQVDGSRVEVFSAFNSTDTTNQFIHNIPDANGVTTNAIKAISASSPAIRKSAADTFFVHTIVEPSVGSFGADGTGIAICMPGTFATTLGNLTAFYVVDGPTLRVAQSGGNKAVPFNSASDFIRITSDVVSFENNPCIVYHPGVKRWFIALQLTGSAGATDGVRALFVGRVLQAQEETKNDKGEVIIAKGQAIGFELDPVAPADVFDGALDKIVGAVGSSVSVSINEIQPMTTSTSLAYLIVQGDVSTPAATKRTVYALPLVGSNNDLALIGSIANKESDPVGLYSGNLFAGNVFAAAATTASQMPLATDQATQVGGGEIPYGDITNMFVEGDAVFVSVQNGAGDQLPGLFHSQPIFDQNGKVSCWTIWRRVAGSKDKVFGAGLDAYATNFYTLVADGSDEVTIVKRTEWGTNGAQGEIARQSEFIFPANQGGVQGVFDFILTSTNTGATTPGLDDISLLVTTGNNGVMLAQTSRDDAGVITPTSSFGTVINFQSGTIDQAMPSGNTKLITIQGGALGDIGPISAAEIARDGTAGSNGYLFVGGTQGIAVLSNADGTGWDATSGLTDGFGGLTAGMTFKKINYPYQYVRKLINDGQYLYVLTNNTFDRIDLTATNVGLGVIQPITLARNDQLGLVTERGTFLDALVSDKLALLATSKGLLKNSVDIQSAVNSDNVNWQLQPLPEGDGAARQIFAVSGNGRSQDVATGDGGYVYVLSAFRGNNQAYAFRYAVTGTSVEKIPDLFVRDIPSYFVGFGEFRNQFATDGVLYFSSRNKTEFEDAVVTTLNSTVGIRGGRAFPTSIKTATTLGGTIVSGIVRNSATGSWLVVGDNGVRINE